MHQKYGFPRLHIPAIAKAATRFLLLGPPRVGLNTYQIMAALRDLGYQPLLLPSSPELVDATTQAIYSYVESEIPVFLLLSTDRGGHAAAVVGHSYDVNAGISSSSNIDLIGFFYIQDDALGPYRTLTRCSCQKEIGDYSVLKNVEAALILFPSEIVLDVDNVVAITSQLVAKREINKLFEGRKDRKKLIIPEGEFDPLVFRAFLMRSNDFKGSAVIDEMDESLRLKYKAMGMPKYIWVIELSTKENIKSGKTVGHIILDSTADRHVSLETFLVINLYGRVIIRIPGQSLTSCKLYFNEGSPLYSQIRRRPVKNE